MKSVAIIVLAAGRSERLGQPKQLVPFNTSNLINHAVSCALEATPFTVIVLGANSKAILPALTKTKAMVVQNPDWQEGMTSSIRIGLQAVIDLFPQVEAVILMACDQPFISPVVLNSLVNESERSNKNIVASKYAGAVGTPVLFHKTYFSELRELSGDMGAKKLLNKYESDVSTINFEHGEIDIDTPSDVDLLKKLL